MKKIDIHCHTTNRKVKGVLPPSADVGSIQKLMYKYDISNTNLLATYFPHKASGISNYRLLHWMKNYNNFTMFASLDFEHYYYQGYNEIEELASNNLINGIKIYSGYQQIDLNSDKFINILDLAENNKLTVMFHGGYSYSSMRKYGKVSIANTILPNDLTEIVKRHPSIPFIISHLSKPFLTELIDLVKFTDNVYSDMSGLIDSKFEKSDIPNCIEQIKRYLGECGPERLLFGTDFPVQTHKDSIYMLDEAMKTYSISDQELVYYKNSEVILKWKMMI